MSNSIWMESIHKEGVPQDWLHEWQELKLEDSYVNKIHRLEPSNEIFSFLFSSSFKFIHTHDTQWHINALYTRNKRLIRNRTLQSHKCDSFLSFLFFIITLLFLASSLHLLSIFTVLSNTPHTLHRYFNYCYFHFYN